MYVCVCIVYIMVYRIISNHLKKRLIDNTSLKVCRKKSITYQELLTLEDCMDREKIQCIKCQHNRWIRVEYEC